MAIQDITGRTYCTGFVIAAEEYYIQTALHCIVEADKRDWAVLVDNKAARLVSVNSEFDLAVLRAETDKPQLKPTTLAVKKGLKITSIGHAAELNLLTFAESEVIHAGKRVIMVRHQTNGMSGGPIIDENGNVIAIIQFGVTLKNGNLADMGASVGVMLALEGRFWRR